MDKLDEIIQQLGTYLKRRVGGRQVGGGELSPEEAKTTLKQLISEAEIKARINEVHQYLERSDTLGESKYATRRINELEALKQGKDTNV